MEINSRSSENLFESRCFSFQMIGADGGYRGESIQWLWNRFQCELDITLILQRMGFQFLPKRWIVERTFSWFGWYWRLNINYERKTKINSKNVSVRAKNGQKRVIPGEKHQSKSMSFPAKIPKPGTCHSGPRPGIQGHSRHLEFLLSRNIARYFFSFFTRSKNRTTSFK